MEPAGAERHRREARQGELAGASESNALVCSEGVMLRLLGWIGRKCGRSARVLSSEKLTPATQRQR